MMTINNKFELKEIVYLITDPDQFPRMVTKIMVYEKGELIYGLSCGEKLTEHYEFEISADRSFL